MPPVFRVEAVLLVTVKISQGITPESLLSPRNSPTMFVIEPQLVGSVPAKAHNKLDTSQQFEAFRKKAKVSATS
jgi:hypothetical protein